MIERVWVKNYRMLAGIGVDLAPFAVLVGRNATGKSTLMSALRFVSVVLSEGVGPAVRAALDHGGTTFTDLCFHADRPIEIALSLRLAKEQYRYELAVGMPSAGEAPVVLRENLFRVGAEEPPDRRHQPSFFGEVDIGTVVHAQAPKGYRKIASKTTDGKDFFRDERTDWNNTFRFGATRSALGNLPEDPDRFPGAIAVRNLLREGIVMVELDSHRLRLPSPPLGPTTLVPDGSNLAAAARALALRDPNGYRQWVDHVAGAVEGLEDIETWERPEDKHVVLRGRFDGLHSEPVPSWLLSDGTLRLMALTLLLYAEPDAARLVLVEEPENGLHPLAIESVHQALSSMQRTQVFVATHSPVFLASTQLAQALVFRRGELGRSEIQRGDEVAELRAWQEGVQLADVFASGVLS